MFLKKKNTQDTNLKTIYAFTEKYLHCPLFLQILVIIFYKHWYASPINKVPKPAAQKSLVCGLRYIFFGFSRPSR